MSALSRTEPSVFRPGAIEHGREGADQRLAPNIEPWRSTTFSLGSVNPLPRRWPRLPLEQRCRTSFAWLGNRKTELDLRRLRRWRPSRRRRLYPGRNSTMPHSAADDTARSAGPASTRLRRNRPEPPRQGEIPGVKLVGSLSPQTPRKTLHALVARNKQN